MATKADQIVSLLASRIPNPKTELIYANEMQLVVAVMLSAQTTDKKVNEICAKLFKKYTTWNDFARASLPQLQADIKGVNFHLGKAERLIKTAQKLLTDFNGKVPRTLAALIRLPGIARKSANVILQEGFDLTEGIVVDTHVTRVATRLGLTTQTDAVKIEQDLMVQFSPAQWRYISGALVLHGRYVCKAAGPTCSDCVLVKRCPSAFKV